MDTSDMTLEELPFIEKLHRFLKHWCFRILVYGFKLLYFPICIKAGRCGMFPDGFRSFKYLTVSMIPWMEHLI